MIINLTGGGGGGLNFTVVGGTVQPVNPKENTIWVNTDSEITSWAFSATEPKSPVEGTVWISTGTSSNVEFNALKKNGIQVYPISAKQYVSGAFAKKTVKIYQNSVWKEFVEFMYNEGDECTNVTGGWVVSNNSNARYAKAETYISAGYIMADSGMAGCAYTFNRIAFNGLKKSLFAEVEVDSYYSAEFPGLIGLRSTADANASKKNSFIASKSITTSGVVELDISSITTGSYYIAVGGLWNGRVKKVWLT